MKTRFGPARVPSRESPETAIELLLERGYSACEIDFEGGFWMKPEWEWAARFGELAKKNKIALSIHAPIAAVLGHLPRDEAKRKRAFGMIDHSAGVATAVGADLLVVHPGYLLGREREAALKSVAGDLAALRKRLEPKGRTVAFGVEVMGRVRELGTPQDVFWLAGRFDWVRPVLDFAHMHAVTDGGFTRPDVFAGVLEAADDVMEPGAPFHVHFSDIAFANPTRRSTSRTARARCAQSPSAPRCAASSGPRRSFPSRRTRSRTRRSRRSSRRPESGVRVRWESR